MRTFPKLSEYTEKEWEVRIFMWFEALLSLWDSAWFFLSHIAGRSSFPTPLKADEEKHLIEAMLSGDNSASARLIEHNLRLVAHIAKKYTHSSIDADDLISIGSIGLMKAVHTFRPEAGKLTTYASRCIENEILMYLRTRKKARISLSLDDPIGIDKNGNELSLMDLMGTDPDVVPQETELRIESDQAVRLIRNVLDEREQRVIVLRYGLFGNAPLPQREVADKMGISRSYVSRIEKTALEKLKKAFEPLR